MVNLVSLAVDPDKERDGVESVYQSVDGPIRIWSRPDRCAAHVEEMGRVVRGMRGDVDWSEVLFLANVRVLFVRWADVEQDEKPIDYTSELGERIFRLPSMQRFYRAWVEASASIASFGIDRESDLAKNLLSCSAGLSGGASTSSSSKNGSGAESTTEQLVSSGVSLD